MHPERRLFAAINVVGGVAVAGSYAHGILTHPATRREVWGGVPDCMRPFYVVSMLLAAVGYFAFTGFVWVHTAPERVRIAGRFGFGVLNALYVCILAPSALWMPLTFAMLESPGPGLWAAIRLVLAAVGLGSLGLLVALLTLRPREPAWAHALAALGCAAFSVQTALLDALLWPAYFPR